jgi:hypothetical protein
MMNFLQIGKQHGTMRKIATALTVSPVKNELGAGTSLAPFTFVKR